MFVTTSVNGTYIPYVEASCRLDFSFLIGRSLQGLKDSFIFSIRDKRYCMMTYSLL